MSRTQQRTRPARRGLGTPSTQQRYTSDEALLAAMGDKVQYSWDRYVTFIHEILLLTGGTILVLINGMVIKEDQEPRQAVWAGVAALCVAVLGMFAGMGWRLTSQYFMDLEVFGASDDVKRYFDLCGTRSVSDYHEKYYDQTWYDRWRRLFQVCSVAAIVALLSAWILGGVFVAYNA